MASFFFFFASQKSLVFWGGISPNKLTNKRILNSIPQSLQKGDGVSYQPITCISAEDKSFPISPGIGTSNDKYKTGKD